MATHPNLDDFKDVTIGLFTLAGAVTSFRLALRLKKKQWWLDDWFALTSMVFMAVFVAGACVIDDVAGRPRHIQIFAYYLIVLGYYIPIWSARLSILFTVIRIAPWPRQHKILMCLATFFVFQWVFLMVQVFWWCEVTRPEWKEQDGALCFLGKAVPICQVITTLMSDLLLVGSPLWILRRVRLNPALRFRLVSVFSISVATTVAAVVHSVLVIASPGAWEAIFGAVEVAVALTVSNASVVVPFFARKVSDSETFQDSGPPTIWTIGGKRGNDNALSTLQFTDMANTDVRVNVTVDEERDRNQSPSDIWDKKKRVDGGESSVGSGFTE